MFRLKGAFVNLVICIVQVNAAIIAGEAPEQPLSSMKVPLLAINLMAYLVTA
jgi:hypothetical protein